jgi:hypothetical protein
MDDLQIALNQALLEREQAQRRIDDILRALPKTIVCPEHHELMSLRLSHGRIEYIHRQGRAYCLKSGARLKRPRATEAAHTPPAGVSWF